MKEEAASLLKLQRANATNWVRIGVFLTDLATILTLLHYLFRKTNLVNGINSYMLQPIVAGSGGILFRI